MAHEPIRLLRKDAKAAVLFIHGILGTPAHFARFLPLVPENMSVCTMLLSGHGQGPGEFSQASMKQWEEQVRETVEGLLSNHERLYIVAHSLGTLLAMEQAVNCQKIAGLYLLACPLRLRLRWQIVRIAWQVYWDRIDPTSPEVASAKACCSIRHSRNIFLYLGWVPRFLELFAKMGRTRKLLPRLQTAGVVLQSGRDEMVSLKTVEDLTQVSGLQTVVLQNSTHFYYSTEDSQHMLQLFSEFLQNH